tara:strand:- start:38 stop:202 length:165 start_codon:yes stop_codon:yes gene_type:complete
MKNTKWDFKNGRILGKIEGKLWTLKMIIDGYCANDNPLREKVEEIEELINKIKL